MPGRERRTNSRGIEAPRLQRDGARDRRRIQLYTIAETADMLRVDARTVRRRIATGELVAHRFRGCVRIAEADLRNFLAVHRQA